MLEKLVKKHALSDLLEIEGCSLALADDSQKIIWYNKSFKKVSGAKTIKGKSFYEILNISTLKDFKKTSQLISLPHTDKKLSVKILKTEKKIDGYFLFIIPSAGQTKSENLSGKALRFQKEFKELLAGFSKENSRDEIAVEALLKSIEITSSDFGFIVFKEDAKKFSFISEDPKELLTKIEAEKEIKSNFSFIAKWFEVNHKALLALNLPENIGFNLAHALQSESLIIAPCFVNDKLRAAIIVGKTNAGYSQTDIDFIEQIASMLSISIGTISIRELNEALENQVRQSQKLETIGKLSSGMAHDFNNLLSSIFGSLTLLKKKVPGSESVTRLIDNIENCSIRAKDLTKGLLSYGKPTLKKKEQIKPNILLNEISKVITQTFPKNIEFESNVKENLYDLVGNGTEIYQVLLNLCVNAKEAIEDEGKITLTAENLVINEKNLINYPMLNKGKYVHISVKDSGSGIKEENLQQIFDPYFSTKSKETGSGSGLGLYVAHGIIKAHQGHVEVSSIINKGTTFDVYLPSYEPAIEEETTPTSDKIILIADDEIMLRDLLGELLESNGYNVIKVTTGVEVLKVLTEEIQADLLILDHNMPEMNGLDCIKEIRNLEFKMPIILSTGSLNLEENVDYKKIGITSLVAKPYEFDTMLSTIQKLI